MRPGSITLGLMKYLKPSLLASMLALGLLHGCSSIDTAIMVEQPPTLLFTDQARFGQRPNIPQPAEILALTEQQQAAFRAYLNNPHYQHEPMHQRVFNYLERLTDGFNYQGDTLTAADALASNSGNCLSLALMTTALAELAGVRISYQLLDDVPVFEFHGTVVEKGYHVRSILHDPILTDNVNETVTPAERDRFALQVDYFPTEQQRFVANLTHDSFIAMYYRNLAADALSATIYSTAYWYLRESLQYAENNSQAINMLAVISRRTGDTQRAEELYRFGLAHADDKLTLLKNYRVLLSALNRAEEAERLQRQLNKLADTSPFHWLQLARESYDAGEYADAIHYYRRALALAPYMHEAYLGVAQAQYESGNNEAAVSSLQKALDNVFRPSTRKLYKAKLYALRREGV
jgi:tetratricopeptide (TPR) repeat protein